MIYTYSEKTLAEFTHRLNSGIPVVMPTETVYGLAAKIDNPESIKRVFEIKKRPFFDPLIVHISEIDQLRMLSHFESPILEILIQKFWPGPLTLVLPKSSFVSDLITSGLDSVGVRFPNHPIAINLIKSVKCPLAAPSANLFGKTSPTNPLHVETEFKSKDLWILDGGDCHIGIESTVVKVSEKNGIIILSILRKGFITESQIQTALNGHEANYQIKNVEDKKESPGHMKHHYMPEVPMIFLNHPINFNDLKEKIQSDFNLIPDEIDQIKILKPKKIESFVTLDFSTDPAIACRELYGKLRSASEKNKDLIIFEKKSYMKGELWDSFLERIHKASSLHY